MAEIVNLRRARKTRARAEDKAKADANAARHGRSKAEKRISETETARAVRHLDGVKRDRDAAGNADRIADAEDDGV